MLYIIKKGNLMVARAGHKTSYTSKLQYAAIYPKKEVAENNKCGNERVVPIYANS